jgi:hypothetical protein
LSNNRRTDVKEQNWIFSVHCWSNPETYDVQRVAIVGPARQSTVEAALRLVGAPEDLRVEIRANATIRKFVEGALDPSSNGYYVEEPPLSRQPWAVCIASIHEVIRAQSSAGARFSPRGTT